MFDFFRKWFDRQKQRENEYKSLQAKEDAENLIQVKEYNRELWLTYNGHLVCPMVMFQETPIEVICKIRTYYIVRNSPTPTQNTND